jgi:hypothetical protein
MVRVNKFMADIKIRKTIEDLIKPIFASQTRLELDLMSSIASRINQLEQRM